MKDTTLKEANFDLSHDDRGFYYLYVREGEEFCVSDFEKVVHHIRTSFNGVKGPFLVELGYGCSFAEGVLETLTTSPKRFSTADALVTNTYAHKLISKFYMRHYNPPTSTEMFDNKEDALVWLQQFIIK